VRFSNIGFQVSRQNLSRWQIQVTGLLAPLTTLMEQHIMDSAVVHLDEEGKALPSSSKVKSTKCKVA
jgi:hypothetical protein